MKLFFQNSNIETYSMHNEGKSVVAERCIRTLKNEFYKYMISISKMCIFINWMTQWINVTTHIIKQLKWNLLI